METSKPAHFIDEIIAADIASGKYSYGQIITRYPPEPNGYIHIGHAKALYISFSMAKKYGGQCNLRYDDTNPAKEEEEFVSAIQDDIMWLGHRWTRVLFGSDYFDKCYELAELLIQKGEAYVCDLSKEEMRKYRGTLTSPGENSPFRDRSADENLDLFRRMRAGEFPDGARTLRAKIDMASPNINMRDPALYRIMHVSHHHTGDKWCIYPMYDFAHPIQDAIEGVTHSLCSMEYEAHRPLYDWVIEKCEFVHKPRQIEFARLNLTNTVMSKRYLRKIVEDRLVRGWDDPRMPTIAGFRRRGFTAEAIADFIERAGVAKADSVADSRLLEHCLREELNETAPRAVAVIDPVPVTILNYPEGQSESIAMENHPQRPELGERTLSFSRRIYIEREDFMQEPAKKFFRLFPGNEVRLKGAYIIKCVGIEKDTEGNITNILCEYDPESKSGMAGADRKVKSTLHWLSEADAAEAEVRLYDDMILGEIGLEGDTDYEQDEAEGARSKSSGYADRFNPNSLIVCRNAFVEPGLASAGVGQRWQFMRVGYFIKDKDSTSEKPVFNRIVGLKDSYKK